MNKNIVICVIIIFLAHINCCYAYGETISNHNNFYAIKNDNTLLRWTVLRGPEGIAYDQDKPEKLSDNVISINNAHAIKSDGSLWNCQDGFDKLMDNVKYVSYGSSDKFMIKTDNSLWGMGLNYIGQLVTEEDKEEYTEPVKIMNNVKKVEAGYEHTIVLKTDGSVWAFGDNSYCQLGHSKDLPYSYVPIKIMENVKDIFVGETAGFALTNDNTLWRWGTNYGNGVDIKDSDIVPEPISYVNDVKQVSSHWGFNIILKTDNTLWIYGDDNKATTGYTVIPTGITFSDLPKMLMDNVNSISEWTQGGQDTLFLKNNGELFVFGLVEGAKKHTPKFLKTKIADDIKLSEEYTQTTEKQFTDISDKSIEMQKAVTALSKAAIIDGVSETEFAPDAPITRAEIAALLLRMTARAEGVGNGGFVDVTSDKWYYNTAGASKKYDIISGYNDNTFRGDEPISNIQLISLVSRMLQCEKAVELKNKETKYNVPQWANTDTAIAVEQRLISEADISDSDIVTRGEAAVLLYRLYEKI